MSRAPVLVLTAAVTAALTVACSAVSKVDYQECSDNVGCRDAFGLGSVCGSAGLCEEVTNERCKDVYPVDLFEDPDKYRDAIIFGSLLDHTPITGDTLMVQAATLAIKEANASGLADGRLFGIVHCDYREDAKIDDTTSDVSAVEAAKYLVDDLGVVAVIGPGYSSLAEAIFLELQKPEHAEKTLIISPSATSDALTNVDVRDGDKPGLFWRTAPPDSVLGKALAGRMEDEGMTTATVIHVQDSYGTGLATALDENFGGDVERLPFKGDSTAAATIANLVDQLSTNTPGAGVAVVFIGAEVDHVVAFLNAASAFPFFLDDNVKLFLGDAAYNDAVIQKTSTTDAPMLYDQVRIAFPSVDTMAPVYASFRAGYQAEFPGDDPSDSSYSSHMYDATWLAVYGTAWAHFQRGGALNGLNLAFGLQQISAARPSISVDANEWNTIKSEFKAGNAINVQGASGNLDYNPETEELKDVATSFYGIDAGSLKFTNL